MKKKATKKKDTTFTEVNNKLEKLAAYHGETDERVKSQIKLLQARVEYHKDRIDTLDRKLIANIEETAKQPETNQQINHLQDRIDNLERIVGPAEVLQKKLNEMNSDLNQRVAELVNYHVPTREHVIIKTELQAQISNLQQRIDDLERIVGPAEGKTALSMEYAAKLGRKVLNCDPNMREPQDKEATKAAEGSKAELQAQISHLQQRIDDLHINAIGRKVNNLSAAQDDIRIRLARLESAPSEEQVKLVETWAQEKDKEAEECQQYPAWTLGVTHAQATQELKRNGWDVRNEGSLREEWYHKSYGGFALRWHAAYMVQTRFLKHVRVSHHIP